MFPPLNCSLRRLENRLSPSKPYTIESKSSSPPSPRNIMCPTRQPTAGPRANYQEISIIPGSGRTPQTKILRRDPVSTKTREPLHNSPNNQQKQEAAAQEEQDIVEVLCEAEEIAEPVPELIPPPTVVEPISTQRSRSRGRPPTRERSTSRINRIRRLEQQMESQLLLSSQLCILLGMTECYR